MDAIATQKFYRMSPRKLRLVADAVKKMQPKEAIEVLPFTGKRAAGPLSKVIKTAIANARVMGLDEGSLMFKEIQIGQGPTLKRGIAVSRGQWHPIKKRMSHIRVVVTEREKPKTEVKAAPKAKNSNEAKVVKKVQKANK